MNCKTSIIMMCLILLGFISKDTFGQSRVQLNSKENRDSVLVYSTAKDTDLRLTLISKPTFISAIQQLETEVSIFVNPNKTFQTFFGIGGAITDASAEVFSSLSSLKQEELLNAYYSLENGIGYSLGFCIFCHVQ